MKNLLKRLSLRVWMLSHELFRIQMQQHKEDNQNFPQDLEQLKQKIKLSSNKLLQLTYNDSKFFQKLIELNQKAKQLIIQDFVQEPLIYLAQAERVLEYGASCGKTIDRNIIICTLHNEACCYYKASDLATASRYIQAVIFNIKTHLDSVDSSPSHSSASDHQRGKKTDDLLFVTLQKKIELIQYYLKYCTINSQAKNRIVALDASKRVIQVLKSLFDDIRQNEKIIKTEENEVETNDLRIMIRQIKVFKQDLNLADFDNYLLLAKIAIKKWNQNKVLKKINFNLQKHISNYSISEVIDMVPIDYKGESEELYSINSRCIMRQILHFSMGYFTISTEYRLISQQLYKKQEQRIKSEEYMKSNLYHLLSIIFLALNVNCDLLFMKQIISSYEHHFKTLLVTEQSLDVSIEELSQKLLYQKPADNLKSINNSLAAKIKKLRSKSKLKDKKIHSEYQDTQLYESKTVYKMNQSKQVSKSKRTNSKQKVISQSKKSIKVLNDSLFESTKLISNKITKKQGRSTSNTNKKQIKRKRSVSKEAQMPIKVLKSPPKPYQKASSKRMNDEYQLGNSKCPVRKRTNSISSSADLSCSIRQTNKTKLSGCGKQEKKLVKKKKSQNNSKQKGLKDTKQTYLKHYYV